MPPKKAGGKKGKKGKKGANENPDEELLRYLDERFYVSPQDREKQRQRLQKKVKAAYSIFLTDAGDGLCKSTDLPAILAVLGLSPTKAQLKLIQPLVEDADTGTWILYDKFEKVIVNVLMTKELKYETTTPEGNIVQHSELIYPESEDTIMRAFDVIWEEMGGKRDAEDVKFMDLEKLREWLMEKGPPGEQLTEKEGDELVEAFDDEAKHVREDFFAQRTFENTDL